MIKTKRPTNQVNGVSIGQKIVAKDKKSLPGLVGILGAEILSELSDEDATLRLMKMAIRNRDYEGFARIDPYIKTFLGFDSGGGRMHNHRRQDCDSELPSTSSSFALASLAPRPRGDGGYCSVFLVAEDPQRYC